MADCNSFCVVGFKLLCGRARGERQALGGGEVRGEREACGVRHTHTHSRAHAALNILPLFPPNEVGSA